MGADFNPYSDWLGIPQNEQPPNLYRLLDIDLFESDPTVVAAAADQRMAQLRSHQLGERSKATQEILNEISTARICLLDHDQRADYDTRLRAAMRSAPPSVVPLVQVPPPPSSNVAASIAAGQDWLGHGPPRDSTPQAPAQTSAASSAVDRRRRISVGRLLITAISVVTGLCALVIVVQHLARPRPERPGGPTPIELPDDRNQSLAGKTVIVPERTVVQDDDGNISLTAADALLEETQPNDEPLLRWTSDLTSAQWFFLVRKPGIFMIEVTYAAAAEAAGGEAKITVNERAVTLRVRDTGGWETFVTDPTKMVAIRRSGRYALVVQPQETMGETLMQLKGIRLRRAPVGGSRR